MGLFTKGASEYRKGLKAENVKDYKTAFRLYEESAEAGYPQGYYRLAICYANGMGTAIDYEKALSLAKEAELYDIDCNIDEGIFEFISQMEKKVEEKKKAEEATAKKAAEKAENDARKLESDRKEEAVIRKSLLDYPDEEYPLADLFHKGVELHNSGDDENALGIFLRIASQGYPEIQSYCGEMYSEGTGTEVDMEKAIFWAGKAAEQGYPEAMYQYAMLHNDLKNRLQWLLKAYKQTKDAEVSEKAQTALRSYGIPQSMLDD